MAVLVVDLLEVVEVDHDQSERALEPPRRSISRSRSEWKARTLASPVSSSVTAWRSTSLVQARVLDGDGGLSGEILEQLLLVACELAPPRAIDITPRYSD